MTGISVDDRQAATGSCFNEQDAEAWLSSFADKHGRPLRVLHIGNIANNAYRAASLQRRHGIEADVVCYDYYHIMGCPEWEAATISGPFDAFYPDWWSMDVGGFARPNWFIQGPLALCIEHLRARQAEDLDLQRETRFALVKAYASIIDQQPSRLGSTPRDIESPAHVQTTLRLLPEFALADGAVDRAAFNRWRLRRRMSRFSRAEWRDGFRDQMALELIRPAMRRRAKGVSSTRLDRVRLAIERRWRKQKSIQIGGGADWTEPSSAARSARMALRLLAGMTVLSLVPARADSRKAAPRTAPAVTLDAHPSLSQAYEADNKHLPSALLASEWESAIAIAKPWADVLSYYDVVQAYSIDGIIPFVAGHPAFACYEHGTIRDIPFEDSLRGRLCRFTYKHAPRVFITNTDVLPSADRIPIRRDRRVHTPHVFDDGPLLAFRATKGSSIKRPDRLTIFSPTRHHWREKDPSLNKGNDILLRGAAIAMKEGADFVLDLVEWGQHVDESKALVKELGLEDRVRWRGIMNREDLWEALLAAHVVADQFTLPALGGVGYEALTLGVRLMTNLDAPTLDRFFGECPPALIAATSEEIAVHIHAVCADPADTARIGDRAADWARRCHSTSLVHRLHMSAYRDLTEGRVAIDLSDGVCSGAAA